MEKLSESEVLELVKSPKNQGEVDKGRKYESRLRLFTESMDVDDVKDETSWKRFKTSIAKRISRSKEMRLNDFINLPLSVVNITESLMTDLYKVFDAGNSYFNVSSVKKNGGEKMSELLLELNLRNWIEETGKEVLKNKPNTIVVIDKDENGKPYLIAVDNNRLRDFEFEEDGVTLEYVSFLHSVNEVNGEKEERVAFYDKTHYHVILYKGDSEPVVESSNEHGAGKCPARPFLKEKLNSKNKLNRRVELAQVLGKLSEWQEFDVYKYYTDHHAPFNTTEMVRGKCGHSNCVNGYIREEERILVDGKTQIKEHLTKCPTCEEKNSLNIGTKILIDPPTDKDEFSAAGKFRVISPDTGNLEYLEKKQESIESYITVKVVGVNDVVTKEAVNETQIKGAFESRTNVLLRIKGNLDELYEWIVETMGAIYIKGKPLAVHANFGTEWYLVSENDLQERYKNAVEMGLPREEIDMIYHQLIETKYKGNPDKVARMKIINLLDPCPYKKYEGKQIQYQDGLLTFEEFLISERLLTFVKKFERENGSIVEFGKDIEEDKKIAKIEEVLNKYANEYQERSQDD